MSLFLLIADLAKKDGVPPINSFPGLWIRRVDEHWVIAVNGHDHDIEWPQTKESMGCTVKPYHCAVMFNGWYAGHFSPGGGWVAAGSLANQDSLEEAIKKATEVR